VPARTSQNYLINYDKPKIINNLILEGSEAIPMFKQNIFEKNL
jgi:hypothetical protein